MRVMVFAQVIGADRKHVFAQALDVQQWPSWSGSARHVELIPNAPVRPGSRFRLTRVTSGRETTAEMEFTAVHPPESFSIGCRNGGYHFVAEFRFAKSGADTEVTLTLQARPIAVWAKVAGRMLVPWAGNRLLRCLIADLKELKASAEARYCQSHPPAEPR